jgi:hypothetical protein
LLIDILAELDHYVKPCGDAMITKGWEVGMKRSDKCVTPAPIHLSRPSDMAVKRSPLQEIGERELFEHGRSPVSLELRTRDVVGEISRHYEPTKAKRRRENLAG